MPQDEMDVNSDEDMSNGYCIEICVLPDGFTVSDPKPLPTDEEGQSQYSEDDTLPDITAALKNVMKVVQDNPVGPGEKEGFASVDQPATISGKSA